ncbi:hypothetical protein JAAARDRAFT_205232 [Jaapia argillacea MUCL 33604]|uniref:SAM-dependent MTase RsmB/NOP-type domain-containing protein n=1 Tax=Jaapia argillacea MUCL 33604 TaxID=933084 RepID=A0A067PZJ6_9AGAM|nr:hypothetical protein JAAARDRAFT_205232 [Jaapia argillacea MUCL 33604]
MARKKGRGGPGRKPRNGANVDSAPISKDEMHNEKFEAYYKMQGILPEDEWDQFLQAFREPLPTTFRVAGCRQTATVLNDLIKNTYAAQLNNVHVEGEKVQPPTQIPWYPEGLAWQFNVPKKVIRKEQDFKRFHSFLVFETDVGNISRQESVSMVPPLFLDVKPHHLVLDMCAAPGSKTAQLLEAIHSSPHLPNPTSTPTITECPSHLSSSLPDSSASNPPSSTTPSSSEELTFPTGLLIANDSDHKRTHMLIHQSARLPSPVLVVTNLDASIFPFVRIPADLGRVNTEGDGGEKDGGSGGETTKTKTKMIPLHFDRILCDVPCSGDGTLRKNMGIWKKWSCADGNGLHSLQLRILQRAMRMLKPGGRIVYSTCSMNPAENEAVVGAALRSIPGFKLIDTTPHLPLLLRRPGLTTWIPALSIPNPTSTDKKERSIKFFPTYASYSEWFESDGGGKGGGRGKALESLWPMSGDVGLERCMRIYPHLQDTGGFFVAVLEKELAKPVEPKKRQASGIPAPKAKKPKLEQEEEGGEDDMVEDDVEEAVVPDPNPHTESNTPTPAPGSESNKGGKQQKGKGNGGGKGKGKGRREELDETGGDFNENPYIYLAADDPVVQTCIKKLHLTPSFPSSNLFVRNPTGQPARSLYLTNEIVKSILQNNDYERLRITSAGTRVFIKQQGDGGVSKLKAAEAAEEEGNTTGRFRILSEGLPLVLPFVEKESVVEGDMQTLRCLLEVYHPLLERCGERFRNELGGRPSGNHVVRFPKDGDTLTHDLLVPIWKSNVSLSLMIDKKAKSALSLRVLGEDVTVAGKVAAEAASKGRRGGAPVDGDTVVAEPEDDEAVDAGEVDENAEDVDDVME